MQDGTVDRFPRDYPQKCAIIIVSGFPQTWHHFGFGSFPLSPTQQTSSTVSFNIIGPKPLEQHSITNSTVEHRIC